MSTDNGNAAQDANEEVAVVDAAAPDELSSLKARADLMGIAYHPSVGLATLRKKINGAIENTGPIEDDEPEETPVAPVQVAETLAEQRIRKRNDAIRLIRIRVSCMNPAKKEHDGEMITVGNSSVGTITKYVPFNNEEGWHVPSIILDQLKDRMCQIFVTTKDSRGNSVRTGKLIKEFNIEIMPDLTPDELQALAQRQAMANGQ